MGIWLRKRKSTSLEPHALRVNRGPRRDPQASCPPQRVDCMPLVVQMLTGPKKSPTPLDLAEPKTQDKT
jgi:hypothetical protein